MKKTLLAAALAVGFAGAAQATSVTLYGVVDGGIGYTQVKGSTHYSQAQRAYGNELQALGLGSNGHVKSSKVGALSGVKGASRWGLKGVEDLGDGLKATFVLEAQFSLHDGKTTANNQLFNRQATLGLAGDSWGTVELGRQTNIASKYIPGIANPFGAGWNQAGTGGSMTAAATVRYDNMIQYRSPKFGGFDFGVGYSFNAANTQSSDRATWANPGRGNYYGVLANGQDPRNLYSYAAVAGNFPGANLKNENKRAVTLGLRYANGPLAVAVTYDHLDTKQERLIANGTRPVVVSSTVTGPNVPAVINPANPAASLRPNYSVSSSSTKITAWNLGASYDFEVVKLHAGFGHTRNGTFAAGTTWEGMSNVKGGAFNPVAGLKVNAYSFGVSAPLGGGKLMVGWQMADPRSKPDAWQAGSSNWDGLVRVDRFDPTTGARLTDGVAVTGQRFSNDYTNYTTLAAKNAAIASGVVNPVYGGVVGQVDASVERTLKRQHVFSVGYDYALSKRTSIYALGSYAKNVNFVDGAKSTLFAVGMHHQF